MGAKDPPAHRGKGARRGPLAGGKFRPGLNQDPPGPPDLHPSQPRAAAGDRRGKPQVTSRWCPRAPRAVNAQTAAQGGRGRCWDRLQTDLISQPAPCPRGVRLPGPPPHFRASRIRSFPGRKRCCSRRRWPGGWGGGGPAFLGKPRGPKLVRARGGGPDHYKCAELTGLAETGRPRAPGWRPEGVQPEMNEGCQGVLPPNSPSQLPPLPGSTSPRRLSQN